jgi:hypothetical protein
MKSSGEVGEVFFIVLDSLLSSFELGSNAIEVPALHQGTLRSVGIDPHAVGFVLLPGLVYVGFLRIFGLVLFFDHSLDATLELSLAGEEGRTLSLEIGVNLFGEV